MVTKFTEHVSRLIDEGKSNVRRILEPRSVNEPVCDQAGSCGPCLVLQHLFVDDAYATLSETCLHKPILRKDDDRLVKLRKAE